MSLQLNTANQALDAEPPIASFVNSRLIGGGPVNAADYEVLGLTSDGRHFFEFLYLVMS